MMVTQTVRWLVVLTIGIILEPSSIYAAPTQRFVIPRLGACLGDTSIRTIRLTLESEGGKPTRMSLNREKTQWSIREDTLLVPDAVAMPSNALDNLRRIEFRAGSKAADYVVLGMLTGLFVGVELMGDATGFEAAGRLILLPGGVIGGGLLGLVVGSVVPRWQVCHEQDEDD